MRTRNIIGLVKTPINRKTNSRILKVKTQLKHIQKYDEILNTKFLQSPISLIQLMTETAKRKNINYFCIDQKQGSKASQYLSDKIKELQNQGQSFEKSRGAKKNISYSYYPLKNGENNNNYIQQPHKGELFLSDVVKNQQKIQIASNSNEHKLKSFCNRRELCQQKNTEIIKASNRCTKSDTLKLSVDISNTLSHQELNKSLEELQLSKQFSYLAQNQQIQKKIAQLFVTHGYGSHFLGEFFSQKINSETYRSNLDLIFRKSLKKLLEIVLAARRQHLSISHISNIDELVKHLCLCKVWMNQKEQQSFYKLIKITYDLEKPTVCQQEMKSLYKKIQSKAKKLQKIVKLLEPNKSLDAVNNQKKKKIDRKKQALQKMSNKNKKSSILAQRDVQVKIALLYGIALNEEAIVKILSQEYPLQSWYVQDIRTLMKLIMKLGVQKLVVASKIYSRSNGNFEHTQLSQQQTQILFNYEHSPQIMAKIALVFATRGSLRNEFLLSTLQMIKKYLKTFQEKGQQKNDSKQMY